MEIGLIQQQKLKLAMTNELRQSINILQYSAFELSRFIEEQALENPLIEIQEFSTIDYKRKSTTKNDYNEAIMYEVPDKKTSTIHEYLYDQVLFLKMDNDDKQMLKYMIQMLDENGYLIEDLHSISSLFLRDYEEIERILFILQSLEPAGIGARSLQECLLIQLRRLANRHALAEKVIDSYFSDFVNKKWKLIARELKVALKEIQYVSDLVQCLVPKPGATFHEQKIEYVEPDVSVEKGQDQQWKIIINKALYPEFKLNTDYQQLLSQDVTSEVKSYVQENYEKFTWLKKSIEQRNQTLVKVMSAILQFQREFFERGEGYLNPLTLKIVADEAEVHESTVSRATNGKFVQTPFGLYELKYFFSSSIQTTGMESVSSDSVKTEIKKIIDSEDKKKPLSDQKISQMLAENNQLKVSRRTVAKYRDQMKIPSTTQRKRFE